jgi:Do/DeqQ family serine protease
MVARLILVSVTSIAIGIGAGAALVDVGRQTAAAPAPQITDVAPEPTTRVVPESETQLRLSFAPVVKAVAPSVVNVYATTVSQETLSPFANDPFFRQFFGGDLFRSRPRESRSLGSGVIVDESGVILTNHHVVEGATDIRVSTAHGHEYAVDLVLDDAKTDLAVLRIKDPRGATFPAVSFADSDALEVGDLVLAIGNPFGVGQTVTSGIVSALARTGVESSSYEFFIQTDAAINPGNSGGALVDLDGRLVGINTAIFTRGGGSIGIGFAVPSNMARVVAEAGIAGGTLVRPWFGARMQEVTADIADSLGLDAPRGALITEIAPGSSAERSGFRPGDVILSADGFPVQQPSAFDFRLATKQIGSTAAVTYFRDGREETVSVALEAPPGAGETVAVNGNTRFRGATVETLNPATAQELGLPFDSRGVVVRAVAPNSPADEMGLRPGDIILSLNGRDMVDAATFASVANARPEAWQIVLQRGGRVFRSFVSG